MNHEMISEDPDFNFDSTEVDINELINGPKQTLIELENQPIKR